MNHQHTMGMASSTHWKSAVCALVLSVTLACNSSGDEPGPTPTPEPTSMNTLLPTSTVEPSDSDSPLSPTPEPEPTSTLTPVPPTIVQQPDPTSTPVPTVGQSLDPSPTPTSSAVPAAGVTSATTAVEMSSADVYAIVFPSIPFIRTPVSTGSGVLIQGSYVVTNYHVVWPYETVWVVFPDGTEQQASVVGWDPISDIAVLGPVNVEASPLMLQNGEDLPPGTELLLFGYPAEVEQFPEPTITRGILSRFRWWERGAITYLQTDAGTADGQSGGALVNSRGEVVGISAYWLSEVKFGLAASAVDIAPIVRKLIQGHPASSLGDRRLPAGPGAFEFNVDLQNRWDSASFFVNGAAGTMLEAQLNGSGDGTIRVSGPTGPILKVDETLTGVEHGSVELPVDGPYFLQVGMASGDSSTFELSGNIQVQPFHDPDDGRTIVTGQSIAASVDYIYDYDWFSIHLNEGETIRVSADSLLVDTVLAVDFPGSGDNQIVLDNDSGGGLSRTNSEMVYRAPITGEYYIVVGEYENSETGGGYYLSVTSALPGTETVHVPTESPTVENLHGKMTQFVGQGGSYRVEVPDSWIESEADGSEGEVLYLVAPNENAFVRIFEKDVSTLGMGELSLKEYADVIESDVLAPHGIENPIREAGQTSHGVPFVTFEFPFEKLAVIHMTFLLDGGTAVIISYQFLAKEGGQYRDIVEDSFNSVQTN